MSQSKISGSRMRRSVADWLIIVGVLLVVFSPWITRGWTSLALVIGGGSLLLLLSHFIYPFKFKSQLERFRRTPISDPSHEVKVFDRNDNSTSVQRGRDVI
jgi:hypothetical protein